MHLPADPIGSIPRPEYLIAAQADHAAGTLAAGVLDELTDKALADTISEFERTGSPVITDGEPSRWPCTGGTSRRRAETTAPSRPLWP